MPLTQQDLAIIREHLGVAEQAVKEAGRLKVDYSRWPEEYVEDVSRLLDEVERLRQLRQERKTKPPSEDR